MIDVIRSASIARRSNLPGPRMCSCPAISSSVRGATRRGNGASFRNRAATECSNKSLLMQVDYAHEGVRATRSVRPGPDFRGPLRQVPEGRPIDLRLGGFSPVGTAEHGTASLSTVPTGLLFFGYLNPVLKCRATFRSSLWDEIGLLLSSLWLDNKKHERLILQTRFDQRPNRTRRINVALAQQVFKKCLTSANGDRIP